MFICTEPLFRERVLSCSTLLDKNGKSKVLQYYAVPLRYRRIRTSVESSVHLALSHKTEPKKEERSFRSWIVNFYRSLGLSLLSRLRFRLANALDLSLPPFWQDSFDSQTSEGGFHKIILL